MKYHLSQKLKRFACWTVYAWYTGALAFYIPFYTMSGINNKHGFIGNIWGCGLGAFSVVIFTHHLVVAIGTRNFTLRLSLIYLFSIMCFMPLTIYLNDAVEGTSTYRTNFSDILGGTALYWLSVIFSCSIAVLPFYVKKCYEAVIMAPQFYQEEK